MDTKEAGRKGGLARVPKGFAMLTPEQRAKNAKKGARKRWGAKKREAGKNETKMDGSAID